MVVGLGNPGPQYQFNRHNVGFQVVNLLAEKLEIPLRKKILKPFIIGEGFYNSNRIILVKPLTYMNQSGSVLPWLFRKYSLTNKNLVVLCDNLDLEPGRCKLKLRGSSASHNGLKSIVRSIGSTDFNRIFIGIGHPGNRDLVRDYVLGNPDENEMPAYQDSYENAAQSILKISEEKHEQVMNELNRKKNPE